MEVLRNRQRPRSALCYAAFHSAASLNQLFKIYSLFNDKMGFSQGPVTSVVI